MLCSEKKCVLAQFGVIFLLKAGKHDANLSYRESRISPIWNENQTKMGLICDLCQYLT